jgi:hypothetical protein
MHTKLWLENKKVTDNHKDVHTDRKTILKWILRASINWIHVAQDRDQWWALVNIIMAFEFNKMQ